MTYQLQSTPQFERQLRKLVKKQTELIEIIDHKLNLLIHNKLSSSLKLHKLKGDLNNYWSVSITTSLRILFTYVSDKIVLTNIGSHDEVY